MMEACGIFLLMDVWAWPKAEVRQSMSTLASCGCA